MKKIKFVTLFWAISSFGSACLLNQPIHMKNRGSVPFVMLRNLKFDKTPKFPGYNSRDELTMHFTAKWDDYALLGGGVGVNNNDREFSEGFSSKPTGSIDIGKVQSTYHTRWSEKRGSPAVDMVGDLQVTVSRDSLVSVKLTLPIFDEVVLPNKNKQIVFTGVNQTLCLEDAEWDDRI